MAMRRECKVCGVHTFRSQCGNCGSTRVKAIASEPETPARFVRRTQPDRAGLESALRSGGVLR